jgi:short-subunit dehydrogenase
VAITLVTGASSGIGRSLARRIAAHGDPVAVLARRRELLDSLVEEIEKAGGRALAVECDVTKREDVRDAVARSEAALGPIERLVANAGGGERTSVDPFDADHVERVITLNVMGTAYCIEAVLPGMLERGSGHLVAMSSLAGSRGLPTAAAYTAAKGALDNLMESLRLDLRGRGVDVTVLQPGFVRTKPRKPGKKAKRKPLRLELEDATALMHRAILERRRRYAFPRTLSVALSATRWLPSAVADALLVRLGGGAAG